MAAETAAAVVEGRALVNLLDKLTPEHADAIRKAVAEKHIAAVQSKVTIRAKSSPTKKDESQPYIAYFANDARGMSVLCGGKIEPAMVKPEEGKDERTGAQRAPGACDYFNYGFDLDVRQPIRIMLEDSLAGPERAIEKVVKSLVDGGLFGEKDAREFVVSQRTARGLPV